MTDFQLAILNKCVEVLPFKSLLACFFHFCQSLYRNIQQKGLQVAYNNPEDRKIKEWHLAFVPIADVERFAFLTLNNFGRDDLITLLTLMQPTYQQYQQGLEDER